MPDELEIVHNEIDDCLVCCTRGLQLTKSSNLMRGGIGVRVMAVGIAPSGAAIKSGKAFAGNSFNRLTKWFSSAGFAASEAQLRRAIYLTSLTKCAVSPDTLANRKLLWRRCQQFLWRQIRILQPALILLLGMEVARTLFPRDYHPKLAFGIKYSTDDIFQQELFPPITIPLTWLLLPHPSGLSRAMNNEETNRIVIASLKHELTQIAFACP